MKQLHYTVILLFNILSWFNPMFTFGQKKADTTTPQNSSSSVNTSKMSKDSSQSKTTYNIAEVAVVAQKLASTTTLKITSSPTNISLSIDGKAVGKTPYNAVLKFDLHDFKLTDGKKIIHQHIKINREFPSTLHFDLYNCDAPRTIKSKPVGATVYINKKEVGITPLTINKMQQSDTLQLRKKEYVNFKRILTCKDSLINVKMEASNPFDYRDYISFGIGIGGGPIVLPQKSENLDRGQNDQVEGTLFLNIKAMKFIFFKNEFTYTYIYNQSSLNKRNHLACVGYPIIDDELVYLEYGIGFDSFKNNDFQLDLFGIGFGSHRHCIGLRYAASKNNAGIYSYEGYIRVGL
jgi:PEGA domain